MKNKRLIIILLCAFIAGFIWYAFTQEWFIINLPFGHRASSASSKIIVTTHKKIGLYLPCKDTLKREERELLWSDQSAPDASYLLAAWLNLLDEEQLLRKKINLQAVTTAHNGQELIISLDRAPFNKNSSTTEKLLIVESLLKSIRESIPTIKTVFFLAHHKPINDGQLDFTRPWPVEGFRNITPSKNSGTFLPMSAPLTLMIDPTGDAQKTGRTIADTFERSITLACAQALKDELEKLFQSQLRIIITREPGETTEPLQSATFSNRLRAHLFINLSCYQEPQEPASCALYYFLYHPVTDFWHKNQAKTVFEPYFSAHCNHIAVTTTLINKFHTTLSVYRQNGLFRLEPYRGIPFKPLIGVQAPAIGCEIGVSTAEGWRLLIGPLVDGISHMIYWLQEQKELSHF